MEIGKSSPGALVGREGAGAARAAVGFLTPEEPARSGLILDALDSHRMTIAPTGAGKGRGVIIPALLTYQGPMIVVDPKGEAWHVTRRQRQRMGQRVALLDPFGVTDHPSDSLNPLDVATLSRDAPEDIGRTLAQLLAGGPSHSRDPFWDNTAEAFISGLITTAIADQPPDHARLSWLRDILGESEVSYNLAVMLDSKVVRNKDAYQEIAIFLGHPERETRPSVQSSASQHLRHFGSMAVRAVTDTTTIPLEAIQAGEPVTLYIVIPPEKLGSHGKLLRLWLGALLLVILQRRHRRELPTLLVVDEAAQLGRMELLLQAVTLLRGYGLSLWTFWQDASQLTGLYPAEWPTMINNCATLQLFGARNLKAAEAMAELTGGFAPETLLALPPDRQLLVTAGAGARLTRRLDYLTDPELRGLYDPNPLHEVRRPSSRA